MKHMLAFAALLTLAACNKAEAPAPADTTAAVDTTAAAPVATGAPTGNMAGTYEVKMADGSVVTETINADGTYSDTKDGKEMERGKWRAEGEKACFDPDGAEPEACFTTTAPAADGSFRTIGADGKDTGVTVRKIAAQ